MASRPSTYIDWVPSGNPSYITQPTTGQASTGWVVDEAPPFQYMNWLFYYTDQWIQYLDAVITPGAPSLAANSLVLTTTGTIAIGSNQITGLGSNVGLLPGQLIVMSGVPTGTVVTVVSGSVVTMNANATSNQTSIPVTFNHDVATGNTIQKQLDELDAQFQVYPMTTAVPTNEVVTVPAGKVYTRFDLTIPAGATWTINGTLVTGNLIILGTLTGTGKVVSLY